MQALEQYGNMWTIIKSILLVSAAISAVINTPKQDILATIGWVSVGVSFAFFPAIVVIGLLILKIILKRKLTFEMPNWRSNPLDTSHPENFLHLAGMLILANGSGGLIATYVRIGTFWPAQVAPIALGLGVFLGLWILKVSKPTG